MSLDEFLAQHDGLFHLAAVVLFFAGASCAAIWGIFFKALF